MRTESYHADEYGDDEFFERKRNILIITNSARKGNTLRADYTKIFNYHTMENLNLNLNLLKLEKAGVAKIHDKRCIIIPVEENDIYISTDADTGKAKSAYISLTAWSNKGGLSQYGDSHYVKLSFSKKYKETHENIEAPIIGNAKPVSFNQGNATPIEEEDITDSEIPF